ncbi:MAG: ABC transporter ATP-binding protein [Elusimicrobia bacterium]|nr:ABC transporter ATP-binding protein [Elusimicrobiota bacterium]
MGQPPVIQVDDVRVEAGGRRILHDVSVVFKPGQLCAILGPSGCGKTTLLTCAVALRKPDAGSVRVGGRELWPMRAEFRRRLGYVPQDDIIHRELTVAQAFRYAALLRLDEAVGESVLAQRVETVMKVLGLDERKSVRIERLSGGQRKRVNIGIELLADPDVLVLDEPASGLDPATEEDLVNTLSRLAKQGRTVALTTHSMEYLSRVDVIVLMAEGRVVFVGALPELLTHFGVPHAGEVFRVLRQSGGEYWASRFRASPLGARARLA